VKRSVWHRHPAVRSGDRLTFGERAADRMRDSFGSWSFIGATMLFIAVWILLVIYVKVAIDNHQLTILNLILSCFAAMQGAIILLAAKRADAISSELAQHTYENGVSLVQMVTANNEMTAAVKHDTALLEEIHRHVTALAPQAGEFAPPAAPGIAEQARAANAAAEVRDAQPARGSRRPKANGTSERMATPEERP